MKITLFRDLPSEQWFSMERYADELYAALQALGVNVRQYVLPRPWPGMRGRFGAWLNHLWRIAVYPLAVSSQQGDVNHILDHSYAHLLYRLDPRRTVVTCHDIAPLVLNEGHGLSRRLWEMAFRVLPRAAHILCDSAYTQTELQRRASITPAHLSVVPLGVRPAINPSPNTPEPNLILHVGSCQPRKNLAVLLRALTHIPQALLVQVGGQPTADLQALISELHLEARLRWAGSVSESELHAHYRAAAAFVFPSTYEGFGLPVLEAMAAGVPVICSNATSLPEVADEAALLFDPHDVETLAAHLRATLTDPALRARLIASGRRQSERFTWENTARATLAVYQQLA